jgi:N-glycosylase/DNA lyase
MMNNTPRREKLFNEILQHHRTHRKAIRTRLLEFQSVLPSEYFYELIYCLLTPQSSAAHAGRVVSHLRSAGFHKRRINPESILRKKEQYIRFHKMKTKYLLQMKKEYPMIAEKLSTDIPAVELREWLVTHVKGIGYKEATHFLRNIGKNDGLAILDRHILRTLKSMGQIHFLPESIGKRRYLEMEKLFMKLSSDIGIELDELDLVVWSMSTGEILK